MLRILGCITDQHDPKLVVLAFLLCAFASWTAVSVMMRAQLSEARARTLWTLGAGAVFGAGVWSTHFIAMLAYNTPFFIGYGVILTLASIVIAIAFSGAGFALVLRGHALVGGAIVGLAVSAMHYVGMAALVGPFDLVWNSRYVIASVATAIASGAGGALAGTRLQGILARVSGAFLFALSIVGLHFTAMSAVVLEPNPDLHAFKAVLEPGMLALTIAAVAILIVSLGLVSAWLDSHLTLRRIDEEERQRAHIAALEDAIAERERVEATLRQMQRVEAIGQLTSGVAHDFNNLLTVILGNVGFLERDHAFGAPVAARRLSHMRIAAERGAKLTSQLLAFSRRQKLAPKTLEVNAVLAAMGDLLKTTVGSGVTIALEAPRERAFAVADPTQLELVILNLTINARDAMEGRGHISIRTESAAFGEPRYAHEPAPGSYVCIRVTDTGPGIPEIMVERVFEPFFTTKDLGKGSGLGLSQVLGFAKQSGGGVRVEATPGRGADICVYLPRADSVEEQSGDEVHGGEAAAKRGRILVVDDEPHVREVTAAAVQHLGYEVVEAASAGAALDVLAQVPGIEGALVDYAMPVMNGAELAKHIASRFPKLPVIFITGYDGALGDVDEDCLIRKPFGEADLAAKLERAVPA